jgi:hypothetical protein
MLRTESVQKYGICLIKMKNNEKIPARASVTNIRTKTTSLDQTR